MEHQRQIAPHPSGLPLVSILIPTHNRPDYAELALQSALAQTYPHIEIIVNDNSDDTLTQERFAPYIERHPHIHYARVPGCGPLENFQYCYARATGEYVNYLMDDDLFHPDKIQMKFKSVALCVQRWRQKDGKCMRRTRSSAVLQMQVPENLTY